MIKFSGDRKNFIIRIAQRVTIKHPFLKKYIAISLWDGYPLRAEIIKVK